jgi:TusA-related sulfurtransferase
MQDKPDHTVDLRDKQCPFTILELSKTLKGAKSGDLIEIVLDGPAALDEIGLWCLKTGNGIEETLEAGTSQGGASRGEEPRIYVRKP